MASDAAVREECWGSCVPVQLRLAESDVSTVEQPPVLYFLVPRHSYLLSLLPKTFPFWRHVLPPGDDAPWVEHNSLPLKWGVPAGVLYDLIAGEGELPWRLTLHMRGYPSGVLPAYDGEAALRGALMNSLKEAAFICRGSSLRVMEMSPGAQEDLYRSVHQQDLLLYRSVVQSLALAPAARSGRQPAVPLRVYVRAGGRGYLSSYEGIEYTSRSVECQRPGGALVTLGEVLLPLIAECLQQQPAGARTATAEQPAAAAEASEAAAGPSDTAAEAAAESRGNDGTAEAGGSVARVGAAGDGSGGSVASEGTAAPAAQAPGPGAPSASTVNASWALREVLVCGVSPPLDTPLAWLHANMHAADMFLYMVAHVSGPQ